MLSLLSLTVGFFFFGMEGGGGGGGGGEVCAGRQRTGTGSEGMEKFEPYAPLPPPPLSMHLPLLLKDLLPKFFW